VPRGGRKGGLVHGTSPKVTEAGSSDRQRSQAGGRGWRLDKGGGEENGSPTCGPRGHSAMIQTEIQMISNKLKTVQTSFDPKGTFPNLIF
jgi:hypothetical protein